MKLHFLGHSEFIIEMENRSGQPVRILSDSWLTDHAFGDLMARNPQLRLDFAKIPPLNAIYLTHPHCDHFDPYSLVQIFRHQRPAILLPETSLFLRPLLDEYLGKPEIFVLRHGEQSRLFGIHFAAYSFPVPYLTNEDDVMMLFMHNEREVIFYEADAALPENAVAQGTLYKFFSREAFENRVYIATRNELEAAFASWDAKSGQDRRRFLKEYRRHRREEMEWEYARFDHELVDFPEIWNLPAIAKVFVGQGIAFPPEIDERFLRLSAPFPLAEVASEEKRVAKEYERNLECVAQLPGRSLTIEKGRVAKNDPIPWVSGMKLHSAGLEMDLVIRRRPPEAPLRDEKRDTESQKKRIEAIIHERFFPVQIANREEPLHYLVGEKKSGRYTIEVRYGTSGHFDSLYYIYTAADFRFRTTVEPVPEKPDELYWANDLEDFLEGTQDLFSNTLHSYEEGTSHRLWSILGLPFLNSDLVYNKIRYHFERAVKGEEISPWVLDLCRRNYRPVQNED